TDPLMLRSPLLPIALTIFVDVLGLTLMLPLLPFYAEHFHATPVVVGTLIASYAVCQLISGPMLGRASDRLGRKPVLLVSQMGTFASLLVIGFSTQLWMLFVGRMIDGLTAGNLTIAQAYISDVTKPEDRTKSFAIIGIAFGSGFLVGPAISGFLAHRYGFAAPAFGAAALSLTSIIFTATLLPATKPINPAVRRGFIATLGRFLSLPAPRRRLLEFFAFTLSFSSLIGGLAMFLERRFHYDVEKTGWVYAYSGLIGGLSQGAIGRLAKKLGESKLSLIGFATMAIGYLFLGFAYRLPVLLGMVTIAGFGVAVTRPSLTTLITKSVGPDEQGAALGASQSLSSIAQIVAAPAVGFLIEKEQLVLYGITAGSFALIGVLLAMQPETAPLDPALPAEDRSPPAA
ncbi:MAG: MFS transporter, partial [Minicystis sp.]